MKTLKINKSTVVFDENDKQFYLVAKDNKLPDGFKARITNKDNQDALFTHIYRKYPELNSSMSLPKFACPSANPVHNNQVEIGESYEQKVVTHDFDTSNALFISGGAGTGKTVLALNIAHLIAEHTSRQVFYQSDFHGYPNYTYKIHRLRADEDNIIHELMRKEPANSLFIIDNVFHEPPTQIFDLFVKMAHRTQQNIIFVSQRTFPEYSTIANPDVSSIVMSTKNTGHYKKSIRVPSPGIDFKAHTLTMFDL